MAPLQNSLSMGGWKGWITMAYTWLDMETYKRSRHFAYFKGLSYPYVGLTVPVDVTGLLKTIRADRLPFFLTVCYCVGRAANRVPEFRQRIRDDRIVEFDSCLTSHTVALENGTYGYCTLDSDRPFWDFLPYALKEQEKAKRKASIQEDEEVLDKIFISTLPWLSYIALIQPVPIPAGSNPRITWGKYDTQGGKTLLPVSVLCHHALVDGLHIAKFYEELSQEIESIQSTPLEGIKLEPAANA